MTLYGKPNILININLARRDINKIVFLSKCDGWTCVALDESEQCSSFEDYCVLRGIEQARGRTHLLQLYSSQ